MTQNSFFSPEVLKRRAFLPVDLMLRHLSLALFIIGLLVAVVETVAAESTAASSNTDLSNPDSGKCLPSAVHVYGVDFFRSPYYVDVAKATVEQIRKAIYPHPVEVRSVELGELDHLIATRQADIVITISGIYRRHLRNGMRDIVTLAAPLQPDPDHAVGSLLLVRKDSGLKSWADLRGKTILLNTPTSFQGTLTIKKELLDHGWDPETFFGQTIYAGHAVEKRLDLLRRGEADATFVSACVVEREAARGHDLLQEFDPAAVKTNARGKCLSSTSLYPNHTLLTSSRLEPEIVRKIAAALYQMSPTSTGFSWVIASSFDPVDEVYRALKAGPYAYLNSWTLERIWKEYGFLLILALAALLFAIWHVWRTGKLVSEATNDIRAATQRQKDRALRYEAIRRSVAIANLSNIVVHELGQPLSAILFHAKSLRKILDHLHVPQEASALLSETQKDLEAQAKRAAEIIELVRGYAKTSGRHQSVQNAAAIIRQAADHFAEDHPEAAKALEYELDPHVFISVNPLEFDLAVGNLIKNAWEACSQGKRPRIEISCRIVNAEAEITIADNGPAILHEKLAEIAAPTSSRKADGLGLGLTIVRTIVKQCLGRFTIEPRESNGVAAKMTLPLARLSMKDQK